MKNKGYATLSEIAEDICEKKGLELETSSFLNSDKKIYVYDNEIKAREYMSYIAEKAGGFCCASRTGKIQIKKLGEDEEKIPQRLFKTYKWGEQHQISRVAYENGTESFKVGDETKDTLSFVSSDFTVLLFLLSKVAQKKMDKGQYPLSAKRKSHTNIPAANILTLLPAAGARKGGFLKKAPFKSPKNFWAGAAGLWASAPKAARQPISPAARRFLKKAPS